MRFVDLSSQQRRIGKDLKSRLRAVLDHGQYIMGPEVAQLEERLAEYTGAPHAIACASGTDALLMALMALGVGPGDAVFTTPFTFVATAEVIALLRAVPVFVDIEPKTFNMDPGRLRHAVTTLQERRDSIHPMPRRIDWETLTPRGIVAVDLFGIPAEYEKIAAIARENNLFLVEDAAQSFGASREGRKACALAPIACTSFFPSKPLGCYGDGGMCFTTDKAMADLLVSIRVHGQGADKYQNVRIGINGRLDTLQAAVLLSKLRIFPDELEMRGKVASRYHDLIQHFHAPVDPPSVPEGCTSAWAQYSVLARSDKERSVLRARLHEAGVPTAVYYPTPLHLQAAFAYLGYQKGDFPVSEDCAAKIFSLPMHPYLTEAEQIHVIRNLAEGS
ncbi:MAG: DegT/DnrJ/EryC1/StrS family aminotransferase [Deltaproteobacteria bacterium]|nr:DegT/DnrJ/EryC1/StrS family aminotransferase [Deltaproteobacteria bacterium]